MKPAEEAPVAINHADEAPEAAPAAPSQPANPLPSPSTSEPLMEEVESFLHRRAELAQKLADEIAATEKKLADLKRTAAMLFPEEHVSLPATKDRKPKKIKPKPAPREEKTETTTAAENASPPDAAG